MDRVRPRESEIIILTLLITAMGLLISRVFVDAETYTMIPNSSQPYGKYKIQTRSIDGSSGAEPPERALGLYVVLTTPDRPCLWFQSLSDASVPDEDIELHDAFRVCCTFQYTHARVYFASGLDPRSDNS